MKTFKDVKSSHCSNSLINKWGLLFFQYSLFPITLTLLIGIMVWSLQHDLSQELMILLISVGGIAIVAISERIVPENARWKKAQGDIFTDTSSLIAIVAILEPLTKIIATLSATLILSVTGSQFLLNIFPNHWPLWAQLLFLIAGVNFGKYWSHRLSHEWPFLWKFHAIHHSAKRIYWLNGFRIHPVNYLWEFIFGVFPFIVLGVNINVLLLYSVFVAIAAVFQHANVKLHHGILNYIFSTNTVHYWHHSTNLKEGNKNYGGELIIWDLVFGTFYRDPTRRIPQNIGLHDTKDFPINNYWKQLLIPFRWNKIKN